VSDLSNDVRASAEAVGITVQADPEPQRNRFVRGDRCSFIRAGVPSLAMKVRHNENTPEAAIAMKWTAERYARRRTTSTSRSIGRRPGAVQAGAPDLAVRIANHRPAESGTTRASSSGSPMAHALGAGHRARRRRGAIVAPRALILDHLPPGRG
jgi:hypothetical protein